MASLLLDTHIVLWLVRGSPRLPRNIRAAIANPGNTVFVSAVSIWEIVIKHAQGRRADFEMPNNLESSIDAAGFYRLPVNFTHALEVASLPLLHDDPFDRMLVAQAMVENLTLVTADSAILRYNVTMLDAS